MNDLTKNILVFIVIIVVLLSVVQGLNGVAGGQPQKRSYSDGVVSRDMGGGFVIRIWRRLVG